MRSFSGQQRTGRGAEETGRRRHACGRREPGTRRPALAAVLLLLATLHAVESQEGSGGGLAGEEGCAGGVCEWGAGREREEIGEDIQKEASRVLEGYTELHRRILDPRDKTVPKRFLILSPLLGIGNSMIEEVTALLLSIVTQRALVIDLFDRSVGQGEPWFAPHDVYARPIAMDKEGLRHFVTDGARLITLPENRTLLYAQFNPLLGCSSWEVALQDPLIASKGRFLGYLPAYFNKAHGAWVRRTFGPYLFSLASNFLHKPAKAVSAKVKKLHRKFVEPYNCSVGIHIRWGSPEDPFHYVDHLDPARSLERFMSCARARCPLAGGTSWVLATDSLWVRSEVRRSLPEGVSLHHMKYKVRPDNGEHARALGEIQLLGKCDHLVTTRLSTFSFAIHARSLQVPWVVSKEGASCARLPSSQDGLFMKDRVHDRWPWQAAQMDQLPCASQYHTAMRDGLWNSTARVEGCSVSPLCGA